MSYQNVRPEYVENICRQADVKILDCRDERSYTEGHLSGAELVTDSIILRLLKADKSKPVVVYCYHGNSSRDFASMLVRYGFKTVYNLEGGWQAWCNLRAAVSDAISPELARWLLQQGFPNESVDGRIGNGMSTLMQACLLAETTIVRALLDAGVGVNLKNDDENNALWFACVSESVEIIRLLDLYGIDKDNANVNGATSLIYSASAGKFTVVKTLVDLGVNLHYQTLDGFNALDSAATREILKFLKPHYSAITAMAQEA